MSAQARRATVAELSSSDGCVVLRVSGELDHTAEQTFLRALGAFVENGHRHLILDVTALTFCDSRGLGCLLAVRWLLRRRERLVLLAGAGRRVTELLALTGSSDLLPVHKTVGQALAVLPAEHRPPWPPVPDRPTAPVDGAN
ncbi:STAS domain-containing protein [Streptomyces monticola]|uniref:Anti-sigma factor antagonist n=1 Tax=Streptomyces monticola TaxID=2666263 RepID=A0ABW2JH20_9ACTN